MVVEDVGDILRRLDVLIVDLHDQISADVNRRVAKVCAFASAFHSGPIGCAAGNYLLNQHTRIGRKAHLIRKLRPDGKEPSDSQTGTTHTAKLHQVVEHGFRRVNRNGETYAGALLHASGQDHAVDAYYFSVGVQQWPAR